MIRTTIRLIERFSDHPLLASLIIAGVLIFGIGFAIEAQRGPDVWTGLLGLVATLSIAMGVIGYTIALSAKGILLYQERGGIT